MLMASPDHSRHPTCKAAASKVLRGMHAQVHRHQYYCTHAECMYLSPFSTLVNAICLYRAIYHNTISALVYITRALIYTCHPITANNMWVA